MNILVWEWLAAPRVHPLRRYETSEQIALRTRYMANGMTQHIFYNTLLAIIKSQAVLAFLVPVLLVLFSFRFFISYVFRPRLGHRAAGCLLTYSIAYSPLCRKLCSILGNCMNFGSFVVGSGFPDAPWFVLNCLVTRQNSHLQPTSARQGCRALLTKCGVAALFR